MHQQECSTSFLACVLRLPRDPPYDDHFGSDEHSGIQENFRLSPWYEQEVMICIGEMDLTIRKDRNRVRHVQSRDALQSRNALLGIGSSCFLHDHLLRLP